MRMVVAILLGALAVRSAAAQTAQFESAVRASVTLERAAGIGPARVSVVEVEPPAIMAARTRKSERSLGTTLMVVGGAAVVIGAIAGGDGGTILIVGGLVTAGYGFYLFEQSH